MNIRFSVLVALFVMIIGVQQAFSQRTRNIDLDMLRRCSEANTSPKLFADAIRRHVTDGDYTLRSIGTSRAGLTRITLRCHRLNAERYLQKWRNAQDSGLRVVYGSLFWKSAKLSKLSVLYFGVTKPEIKQAKASAQYFAQMRVKAQTQRAVSRRVQLINFATDIILYVITQKSLRTSKKPASLNGTPIPPTLGPIRARNY